MGKELGIKIKENKIFSNLKLEYFNVIYFINSYFFLRDNTEKISAYLMTVLNFYENLLLEREVQGTIINENKL